MRLTPEIRQTTCNRDCPDACGLVATVDDGRVVRLDGDPSHPVTRGFICHRTRRFVERQNSPDRLTVPLVRDASSGELRPTDLGTALDLVADRLATIKRESGPAAIVHYRSGGSLGLLKLASDRFFSRLGPCTVKVGDICSGAGEAAQELDFGISESNDLFDLLNSRNIIVWGKNVAVSNIHLIPVLKDAKARGARITLIDAVHHRGAATADEVVLIRPGGDLDLALGVARLLIETGRIESDVTSYCDHFADFSRLVMGRSLDERAAGAGLPIDALDQIADRLAEGPTAILVGWGMQRRSHGGAIVRALDALSAITGNLFRSGGGCSFYFGRRTAFSVETILGDGDARKPPRSVRDPLFGRDVLAMKDPPIRAIWVTAANPVAMLPDSATVARAFDETEFSVVVDSFLTDTARRASVVLPCPTLLEDDDLLGAFGHHYLAESRPVVPPPDGVVHELVLFQELARRLGFAAEMAGTVEETKRRLLTKLATRDVTLETLRANGPVRNPFARKLLFEDRRVLTPNGHVQLLTERDVPSFPDPERAEAGGAYPLWLLSNSITEGQSSQLAGDPFPERIPVIVHPESAPRGRAEGDVVSIESALGRIEATLRLDPRQRRDVAIVPKGGHFDRGQSANALIAAKTTDIGLGAAYLDCRVRLG